MSVYNHHNKSNYRFAYFDQNTLTLIKKTHINEEVVNISLSDAIDGRFELFQMVCHPTKNILCFAYALTKHSNAIFIEIDLDTSNGKVIKSTISNVIFVSSVEEGWVALTNYLDDNFEAFEISFPSETVRFVSRQIIQPTSKIYATRKCADGTEQFVMFYVSPEDKCFLFFRVFDPITKQWSATGNEDSLNELKQTKAKIVTSSLPNGGIVFLNLDSHFCYVTSPDTKAVCAVLLNVRPIGATAVPGHSVFLLRYWSKANPSEMEYHFSVMADFFENETKNKNKKLLQFGDEMLKLVGGEKDTQHMDTEPIKQYLCGFEPQIDNDKQLNDFMEFALAIDDYEMIAYSWSKYINLRPRLHATSKPSRLVIHEVVNSDRVLMARLVMEKATEDKLSVPASPLIALKERLKGLMNCPKRDLVLVSGSVSVSVHSFILRAASGYFESYYSFHSSQTNEDPSSIKQIDVSEMVGEKTLEMFVKILYDLDAYLAWTFNDAVQILQVVDAFCCEILVQHISKRFIQCLSISNLHEFMREWYTRFSHIDLFRDCCEELLRTASTNSVGYKEAQQAFVHYTQLHLESNKNEQ
jgi:hypothetical protein